MMCNIAKPVGRYPSTQLSRFPSQRQFNEILAKKPDLLFIHFYHKLLQKEKYDYYGNGTRLRSYFKICYPSLHIAPTTNNWDQDGQLFQLQQQAFIKENTESNADFLQCWKAATVSDKTHTGSIVYHCSCRIKKVRERQQKHITEAQREREAKDKPVQLLSS